MIKRCFLFLLITVVVVPFYSQDYQNGYYICQYKPWFYLHGDSLLLPYHGGTLGIRLRRGELIDNKWIYFVPVPNKIKFSYKCNIIQKWKSKYPVITFSVPQDTRTDTVVSLDCQIIFTDFNRQTHKIDTVIIRDNTRFNFEFLNTSFLSASLCFTHGGKTLSLPIIQDTTTYYEVYRFPFLYYDDEEKRMRFKYKEKEQAFYLQIDVPSRIFGILYFKKKWFKYVPAKPDDVIPKYRVEKIIDQHIRDLTGMDNDDQ